MEKDLSKPSKERLIQIYQYLDQLDEIWNEEILSSGELESLLGIKSTTIRKDLNSLGSLAEKRGYRVKDLKERIKVYLNLEKRAKGAIIGLKNWGQALIQCPTIVPQVQIVAGFDTNANLLERTQSSIKLFQAFEIEEVFQEEQIEIALICQEGTLAQKMVDRAIKGGARGIFLIGSQNIKVPSHTSLNHVNPALGILNIISQIRKP